MNLLIIEDDKDIADFLINHFTLSGENTDHISRGEGVFEKLANFKKSKAKKYDAIIIDWMLEGADGIDISKQIREISDVPILMISVKKEIDDIVKALDSGIDDYLIKPFNIFELEARIKKIIRKSKKLLFKNTKLKKYGLEIDLKNKTVKAEDKNIELTKTEYKIFLYLLINKNIVVSKNDIQKHIFHNIKKTKHFINMHIMNLRKKFDKYIRIDTVHSCGFIIKAR